MSARLRQASLISLFVLCLASSASSGHDYSEESVAIPCSLAEAGGVLALPAGEHAERGGPSQHVCVVIVGGTLSQTADGALQRDGAPPRDALKRLARALATNGYASVRYDKVGFGTSKPKPGWAGTYGNEAELAAAAIGYARKLDGIQRVVVAGESAGAYLACLAAKNGTQADGYLFLGGHCDSGAAIYEYNFGRLLRLAESDVQWRAFAEQGQRTELALGKRYREMFAAAARGDATFELEDGDFRTTVDLTRRQEELRDPPDEQFQFIKAPSLALSGEFDLNVPPDHAARIVETLRRAGNHDCTCVTIAGCDHSFQISPQDEQSRLRERYDFSCFEREYSPQCYQEIVSWLDKTFADSTSSQPSRLAESQGPPVRAKEAIEREPKTDSTPERVYLAPGIQLVEDVADQTRTAGVRTLEGRIGPLLLGDDCQAHFIDMPAGMYCGEHPHSSESLIYTVRGNWVLCSQGRRHVMRPGSLFHFAANTPTGYEVPYHEDAFILIFKGQRQTAKEQDFINYLQGMAERLQREHASGVPYLMSDLPDDHPAVEFAREVNPGFDK